VEGSSELVVSDVVLQELAAGRPEQALLRLNLVKGLRRLRSGPAELTTALTYMRLKVMPGNPLADALHLAIASHHQCDVLVTWNYQHLANPNKLDRIRKLNAGDGTLPSAHSDAQATAGGWMMNSHERPPDSSLDRVSEIPRPPLSDEMKRTLKSVGDFIERAREHHARTGEWPPDPLLDEIDEMRRRVQAEHGNDPWKLLEWYNQAGSQQIGHDEGPSTAAPAEPSAELSR
jgi:hypothetical protein